MQCSVYVWRGTIQEKGVVGDGGVDRLGLAEGIGRRPVGTPSTTMGIVTCILKRWALKNCAISMVSLSRVINGNNNIWKMTGTTLGPKRIAFYLRNCVLTRLDFSKKRFSNWM